ncbi:hypothetical protein QIU18_07510 [Capnocytophaga canimorsus]|nr:hypothetical protein [Capnocytophaga canimorsus]WGU71651.1 hypothetical protein QIU18_07510 [Capnocytophaga canimorsus]
MLKTSFSNGFFNLIKTTILRLCLKKHHLKIRLAFVVFLVLLLNKFLREGLDILNIEKAYIYYLLKIGAKTILFVLTLWLIKKE